MRENNEISAHGQKFASSGKVMVTGMVQEEEYYRVRAEIDLEAIRINVSQLKDLCKPNTKLMAIVKADAYGHGAVEVARTLDQIADAYGVAIIEEAITLRNAKIDKPILILGYTSEEQYNLLVSYNISQAVFSYEMALALDEEANKQGKVASVHIKLDTGMCRIGFSDTKESIEEIKKIGALKHVRIDGIFSHMARADEADKSNARQQIARFEAFNEELSKQKINIPLKHISNTAGIIDLPEANFDMVRCGISTYGLYPSNEVVKKRVMLHPAMQLKTHVIFLKRVPKGTPISYGGTFVTGRETMVATIPVGYADGIPRLLSNKGSVLVDGEYAPIIGRICMDQFMIDVTDIPNVKQGDVVTIIGVDGPKSITVEEIEPLTGIFNYEFVCDISNRVPRVYKNRI